MTGQPSPWPDRAYRAIGVLYGLLELAAGGGAVAAGRFMGTRTWPLIAFAYALSGILAFITSWVGLRRHVRLGVWLWASALVVGLVLITVELGTIGPSAESGIDLALTVVPCGAALLLLRRETPDEGRAPQRS